MFLAWINYYDNGYQMVIFLILLFISWYSTVYKDACICVDACMYWYQCVLRELLCIWWTNKIIIYFDSWIVSYLASDSFLNLMYQEATGTSFLPYSPRSQPFVLGVLFDFVFSGVALKSQDLCAECVLMLLRCSVPRPSQWSDKGSYASTYTHTPAEYMCLQTCTSYVYISKYFCLYLSWYPLKTHEFILIWSVLTQP